ncbi:MAG: M2 family metallopeptidase [Acidobacteria bacterium]|nr:M2 family metallopeptidase [Acidobacteriota bacterium]
MKRFVITSSLVLGVTLAGVSGLFAGEASSGKKVTMEQEFRQFVKDFEARVAPLEKASNLANFDASISGKKEDYDKAADLEIKTSAVYADKETFRKLEAWKKSNAVKDPLLKRQLDVLFLAFKARQLDLADIEALIRQQKVIEEKFNTFRVEVGGRTMTDNAVESTLVDSTDLPELRAVWEGSKKIGALVAADVVKLAKLRNETARKLGFGNFHEMQLILGEQDPREIAALFDELDALTRDTFTAVKKDLDARLAVRLGIDTAELMPWHYQNRFFQEAPKVYAVDLDQYYKGKDVVDLNRRYFAGIGLPLDDILSRSDLYEKDGKYQHAYCTDIDRSGDVRIVCNVKDNFSWMGTMLHESGHAVYDKFIDPGLPWVLRTPAHTFTTEAVAMFFGRLAANPAWLQTMAGISPDERERIVGDCFKSLRLQQLVFSRWAQVMYRFEKALYENPDQDLDALWWALVEKYQMIRKPAGRKAPDWASKIHIATVPAYYHNYQLGELLASQFLNHAARKISKSNDLNSQAFVGDKALGRFFMDSVFKPGARYEWNEMIRRATGEKLSARYFARQFVDAK